MALALPLTYGLDLIRSFLLGSQTVLDLPTEIAILVLAMTVAVPAGYAVFLAVDRFCRTGGRSACIEWGGRP